MHEEMKSDYQRGMDDRLAAVLRILTDRADGLHFAGRLKDEKYLRETIKRIQEEFT